MRDALNRDLMEGDVVHVKIGHDWAVGTIVNLKDGGLSLGLPQNPTQKTPPMMPHLLVLQMIAQMPIPEGMSPSTPLSDVILLNRPMGGKIQ